LFALSCICLLLLAGTAWTILGEEAQVPVPPAPAVPAVPPTTQPAGTGLALAALQEQALATARRSCSLAELDRFVATQRLAVDRAPTDAGMRRLLAKGLLERLLLRTQTRGMVVGEPVYAELPAPVRKDCDEALALLARARELGDDSAENWRLEASVLSHRLTGLGSALQWNGRIQEALANAGKRDGADPALHLSLGLRKLFAPNRLLGHDPEHALEHLEFAAGAMLDDERPGVFAAMAAWLLRRRAKAIEWLERATANNPNNVFARVVLARLRRDEPEPFARDVTAAEAQAVRWERR
jgi:tetratricopeptide (TPR) repeat protein